MSRWKKCRDKALHNEKYLKENIEYELQYREQHYKKRKRYAGESDKEERRRSVGFTDRYNAGDGTYSGKGLGHNGESATTFSRFSASGNEGTGTVSDSRRAGRGNEYTYSGAEEAERKYDEGACREAQKSAGLDGKSAPSDEGNTTTGWEESRKNYERYLGAGQRAGGEIAESDQKDKPSQVAYPHRNIGNGVGTRLGAVSSGLRSLAGIIQQDEDEEERRKRIEAEQNGDAIGTVIGLAVGLVTAVTEDKSEELPDELKDEQSEIRLKM